MQSVRNLGKGVSDVTNLLLQTSSVCRELENDFILPMNCKIFHLTELHTWYFPLLGRQLFQCRNLADHALTLSRKFQEPAKHFWVKILIIKHICVTSLCEIFTCSLGKDYHFRLLYIPSKFVTFILRHLYIKIWLNNIGLLPNSNTF